ncbi:MAG: asparagine synthase (glutamine-hydrolyzing) [Chloroflexi bacterium RBG_13_68_17]|nr:MAG: asparagine synthase (glutamine-hydrolyzing) [Chloroflexi bacterium RBG_13_68_17]
MCGIAGVLNQRESAPVSEQTLRRMLALLRHRGPDEFGIYRDDRVGLASARLSIVDLSRGQQPIGNEDGSLWIVFNGEIFNYVELRPRLEARGHRFSTNTDTEVILHLYEDYGPECLRFLNGQFAIALWDSSQRRLLLARDRLGIRPLYYRLDHDRLIFASEIKAMLAIPELQFEIDSESLGQTFTYWSPLTPRSAFAGVQMVPPGHYLWAQEGRVEVEPYWSLDFAEGSPRQDEDQVLEEFEHLLVDATRIRLRADVPVGAYLSGGLDSSVVAAIIRRDGDSQLDTFSIAFSDPQYDESPHQRRMADFLGTRHQEVFCTQEDIGRVFPDVVWHTETPILRTAPAPMYLLSDLVHRHGYKVVLTGEGADEVLAGYDIFKEMRLRRFWARVPGSRLRPALLRRLYPDIPRDSQGEVFWTAFFRQGLEDTHSPFYSHQLRWANTARLRRFLDHANGDAGQALSEHPIPLPAEFDRWAALAQAQYLEVVTFLSPYLLSSQGDRVAMAHSVEGRYPFLDYRVVEFCNRLPADMKLRGLNEKWLLRRLARGLVPEEIWRRTKRPYRAPIQACFLSSTAGLEYVDDLLSPEAIRRSEYFNPASVEMLLRKARGGTRLGEVDEMGLVGILSTQLVDRFFVRRQGPVVSETQLPDVKVVDLVAETR